jgi:tetratricopeptide (TPR) repeat protein
MFFFLFTQSSLVYALPISNAATPSKPKQTVEKSNPVEASYQQGLNTLSKGALDEADKAFSETLRLDSKHVGSLLGLADVAVRKGKNEDARKHLQKALALAPENAAVQTAWGRYSYSQKKTSEAETAFKKAISLDPKAVEPRVDLGTLYLKSLNQPAKAVESLRGAIKLDPARGGTRFALGAALLESGQTGEAEKELREAARLAPQNPLPLQVLGGLYKQQKKFDKALAAYDAALAAQSTFMLAYIGKGDVYLAKKDEKKALAAYEVASKGDPKLVDGCMKIGMIHQKNNRFAESEKAYLSALKIDPNIAVAYNNLAWQGAEHKTKLNESLVWAKKAVSLSPQSLTFLDTLGWVHRSRGELKEALPLLEKASSSTPQQPETLYHLGVAYAESGNRKDAIKTLSKALGLSKNFYGAKDAEVMLKKLK